MGTMKKFRLSSAVPAIFFLIFVSSAYADELIYDNSILSSYKYNPGIYTELLDYGTSQGGLLSKFAFHYIANSATGTIWIRFYQGTNQYDPGYPIKQFALTDVPPTNGSLGSYEYVIPEGERIDLPEGDFGYSFEFSKSTTYAIPASGGAGNEDYFWVYDDDIGDFMISYFVSTWSGFSMKIYTSPPIDEVTCDISGYKFDDANGNRSWDAGEAALAGWEIYIDQNGDGAHQTSEPNVLTDSDGMYFFKNLASPETYTIREVTQVGWTQTLPGSGAGNQYVIDAEPNNVYGPYNFGNTTLSLKYSGGDGSAQNPYLISTCEDLDSIEAHPEDHNKHFLMTNDIDLHDYPSAVFNKINYFAGVFDGQNYTLRDFNGVIRLGTFGQIQSPGIVKNLNIINLAMDFGGYYSGGLAGLNAGQILNCHVRGTNLGIERYVGGLVGYNSYTGVVSNCSFEGSVSGDEDVGGLVGFNYNGAQILNSFARADVLGRTTGTGGLVGTNYGGVIHNCYSVGSVTGNYNAGGFAGNNVFDNAIIQNSYSVGIVSGNYDTGGFTGSTGFSSIVSCFWNVDFGYPPYFSVGESGAEVFEDIEGLTTGQMRDMSVYTGWDFETVWRICDGMNYPRLQWEPKPVGDFVCPEGVELTDLMILCEEWLAEVISLSADIAPQGGDGMVDLQDWMLLANAWLSTQGQPIWDEACDLFPGSITPVIDGYDLVVFAEQWLSRSAHYADIAPEGVPDGKVDLQDFALLGQNWLTGLE